MRRAPVKVCVRTRPTASFAQGVIVIDQEAQSIEVKRKGAGSDLDASGGSISGGGESGGTHDHRQNSFKFQFHHVLHNAGQDSIYDGLARDVVQGAVDGVNGTIMSYGQTGSGKTFTMIGDTANYQHRGIVPRALSHIFQEVAARSETAFSTSITYLEIYNEKIFDLLLDPAAGEQGGGVKSELTIAEERGGRGIYVRGLTTVPVASEQEALNLLYSGELMRTTAQHNLNRCSNRSHCILTVHVTQRARSGVSEKVVSSKLNLVDLAGSERLKKALDLERLEGRSAGDATIKKESMYINQSLSYLEQCVVALGRRNPGHVPYRQSKLANMLRDSLGGNCNTLLVACVWGEERHLEETLSTLRLAARMMRVQNETHATEVLDPARLLRKQEKALRDLRQELLMHDALAERRGVAYDPFTPEQQEALRQQLERYVGAVGPDDEDAALPTFESVRQMKEVCRLFKGMVTEAREDAARAAAGEGSGSDGGGGGGRSSVEQGLATSESRLSDRGLATRGKDEASITYVGQPEKGGGFGLGRAPDHAFPPAGSTFAGILSMPPDPRPMHNGFALAGIAPAHATAPSAAATRGSATAAAAAAARSPDQSPRPSQPQHGSVAFDAAHMLDAEATGASPPASPTLNDNVHHHHAPGAGISRGRLFEAFAAGEGCLLSKEAASARAALAEARAAVRATAAAVNAAKEEIDAAAAALAAARAGEAAARGGGGGGGGGGGAGGGETVLEEAEFALARREREAKRRYKGAFYALRGLREGAEDAAARHDAARRRLAARFEEWARERVGKGVGADGAGGGRGPAFEGGEQQRGGGARDSLDANELFESMEIERVRSRDPDAVAFFAAMKNAHATKNQNTLALRQVHRSKRHK
ncbi:kinesin-like protein [Tribonema minus]|uniref:Kinesin-like protein n=1 Tax=Tribonema minus TaxID=303371 RepID=A0A836CGR5_9STRA|nr:kinesin-like protein [Tribonema minus]